MSYWLHPEAEAELGDAAVYYLKHASRAVAVYEPDDRQGPQIFAVAHQHRAPGYWAERVER